MKARMLAVGLVIAMLGSGALFSAGCAPKNAPDLTPSAKAAYTATQVIERLQNLQNAAIQAEAQKQLDTPTTRIIVTFTRDTTRVLKETPAGWQATVLKAWDQVKRDVPSAALPTVQVYWSAVDIALAALVNP